VVEPVAAQRADQCGLERQADRAVVARVLGLGIDADREPGAARSMTSWKVGISKRPSYSVLPGRSVGIRSFARRVLISASVKSSANQPSVTTPSIVFVARRSANSGRSATSVVPEISFSCRATRWPSRVETRSGSMKSAPWRAPSS
jgi:hypothetical protein